ncbi:MAG TPA: GNAT family N-acetyltransferase [Methanothrix sp.]|nr:GNAT family N-acetyltransferase [Methanothrix sp.]HPR66830.1 GNAT family N-acetyltransferase [Methanothrix sp.]
MPAIIAQNVRARSERGKGIGTKLLHHLTYLAKRRGLLGFSAEVLSSNQPMRRLFEKIGFDIEKRREEGVYGLKMKFREV